VGVTVDEGVAKVLVKKSGRNRGANRNTQKITRGSVEKDTEKKETMRRDSPLEGEHLGRKRTKKGKKKSKKGGRTYRVGPVKKAGGGGTQGGLQLVSGASSRKGRVNVTRATDTLFRKRKRILFEKRRTSSQSQEASGKNAPPRKKSPSKRKKIPLEKGAAPNPLSGEKTPLLQRNPVKKFWVRKGRKTLYQAM